MSNFDYSAPAELFPAKVRIGRRIHYRRFDTAAEAIRFAIEELPALLLAGAYLQVEDDRFAGEEIRELYESAAYALERPS